MDGGQAAFMGVERSLGGRRWRQRGGDERMGLALAQRLGVPEVLGRLLAARGVGLDGAESFLQPTLRELLPDPAGFRDMDKAVARVLQAIEGGEAIAVFGDYDVDGATSAALLHRFLAAAGIGVRLYIPDRMAEGYGPNAPALLRLKEQGVSVVITVDCGITAFAPLEAAAGAGLSVIVLDHHVAEPRLPPATAVVNPNRLDETAGHGQLAAVGVTFLFAVALNRALRAAGRYKDGRGPDLLQLLDLVALGTVCDVVPLTGINRALVAQGLKVLARRGNLGLAMLGDVAGLKEAPGAYHLGFVLGPRINAGGRVGAADLGVRLLTTEDPGEARALAQRLEDLNGERRVVEQAVLDAAIGQAEAQLKQERALLMAAGEGWHPGVIGIVAGRLKERFNRPTCVVAVAEGIGKGSGRSVPGVDLGSAVIAARQAGLLINGGGHAMAAGFTVAADGIADLGEFLNRRMTSADGAARQPLLDIDGMVSPAGVTVDLARLLQQVGPFGSGNPEPRFAVPDLRVIRADLVGDGHVKAVLVGADGARLKAIAFRSGGEPLGRALLAGAGAPLHLAGNVRLNSWQGRDDVQLVVDDGVQVAGGGV